MIVTKIKTTCLTAEWNEPLSVSKGNQLDFQSNEWSDMQYLTQWAKNSKAKYLASNLFIYVKCCSNGGLHWTNLDFLWTGNIGRWLYRSVGKEETTITYQRDDDRPYLLWILWIKITFYIIVKNDILALCVHPQRASSLHCCHWKAGWDEV